MEAERIFDMRKLFCISILILIGIVLLSGCAFFNNNNEPSAFSTETVQQTVEPTSAVSMKPAQATPPMSVSPSPSPMVSSDPVTYKDNKIKFEYYDVAQDKMVDATVEVEGTGDVHSAIDAVNDVYIKNVIGDAGVQTNSIIYKEGNIYVDFTDSIYNLNLGSSGESGVLDSIADAYLNNVEGIESVYFSVNDYDYSSGHIEFSKDKPYKTK
ncbi:hypothetical protein SDC9_109651 [bioreactor metagenome]|uniref:GerMN domain-containing protein n=1 Tax=bioreactor metagenome TaxID=1076179 RepID=A0A645BHV2_9ZZZZ